jgi:feruloyl-CoA synthase
MSAKPEMSVTSGGSAAPLRAISFGDPAVLIERREDGTIYL